jgi:hypothetical protein
MTDPEAALNQLESIDQLLPEKCRGCISGILAVRILAGLSEVIGNDQAAQTLEEIDRKCEGNDALPANLSDYIDEDGVAIPLSLMIENPNCPYAQSLKATCEADEDLMLG